MTSKRPLVDYASSEDEDEPANDAVEVKRVRTVPHIEGNWATLVYIKVAASSDLVDAVDAAVAASRCPAGSQRLAKGEWHISLSKTAYLKVSHIRPLVDALQRSLKVCRACTMWPTRLAAYSNDAGSTSFLAVDVSSPNNQLVSMVAAVDSALSLFGYETYYDPPRLHFTVAWAPGSASYEPPADSSESAADLRDFNLSVERVHIRAGNKHFHIPLLPPSS